MTPEFTLNIEQGIHFIHTFNWYGGGKFMAPIEDILIGYPTVIRVTGHGLPHNSPTPVIISGVDGCPDLNSVDTGIELASKITDDTFSIGISTVGDKWIEGTGEITYFIPTNLEGYTGEMKIRKNWHSEEVIHTISTANGGMLLTAHDGGIQLEIPAEDTAEFTFVNAVYDVDLIDLFGTPIRVFKGKVVLHREISK